MTTRPRPFEVDETLYPFESHWFERDGAAMHYVDHGEGPAVVMMHGNPSWSFLYRKVILELGEEVRCLAPDLPGFGMSDHPAGYGYTPAEHARWVRAWLDSLELDRFVIVLQDWGGPIGVHAAGARPEQIAGALVLNTWSWPADFRFVAFSLMMGGPMGPWMHQKKNIFVRKALLGSLVNPASRSGGSREAYLAPFPTPESRRGTYVFPREIRRSGAFLQECERRLQGFKNSPLEFLFAQKDPAFHQKAVLERWRGFFPDAPWTFLPDANHYLQDDDPVAVAAGVRRVLEAGR